MEDTLCSFSEVGLPFKTLCDAPSYDSAGQFIMYGRLQKNDYDIFLNLIVEIGFYQTR
jgi:hypothetical protein